MARALCITPAKMALFTHHCLNHSSILLIILLLFFSLSDYRLRRGQGQCEEQIRAEWAYFYFAVRWAIDWGFAFEALRTSSAKTICTKGRYKRPRWTRANQVGTNGTAQAPMGLVSGVCHVCQDDRNMHERYYIVGLVYSLRLTAEWF